MTGADLVWECLKAQGVSAVFGMPGTQNLAIYDALHRHGQGIQHFLVRNEQAATMMAGGFARASGEVGVAITVPGPGASNAATGIGDAFTDCQPVLLLTGGVERSMQLRDRSKMFHGLDQASFFRPIVRYYGCPQNAWEIPQAVRAAFSAMWNCRPGPAVIEIPPDVAAEEASPVQIPQRIVPQFDHRPNAADVRHAASLLRQARRPAILCGGDVIASAATPALERLAAHLNAPVIHTRLGKGALATDSPYNMGNSRHKRARAVLEAADALVAVGVRFTQIDTANWHIKIPACLVQIERDPAEVGREFPVSVGLTGDLTPSIEHLIQTLGEATPAGWNEVLPGIRAAHSRPAQSVLASIRSVLPRDGILACDVTSLSYRAFDEYPIYGPRDFMYPCHFVTMGYGLPSALGAKVACPDRPVIALCGDGGVMMSIGELATAVQYGIAAVIVVVVDQALLAIKASQQKHYEARYIDTELLNPDFVALAKSFGITAHRADNLDQFKLRLSESLSSGRPALVALTMTEHTEQIMQQIPWLSGE